MGRNLDATGVSAPGEGERLRFNRACLGRERESVNETPAEAHEGGVASIDDDCLLLFFWLSELLGPLREKPPRFEDQGNRQNIHAQCKRNRDM